MAMGRMFRKVNGAMLPCDLRDAWAGRAILRWLHCYAPGWMTPPVASRKPW